MDSAPLVLVPGLLCDAQLWSQQVGTLRASATWIADVTRDDSMAGMASRALAEAPYPEFALAGLSMGGYVAMEMMRQAPGRVRRLALLDTQARADTPEATERRLALIELARRGKFMGVTERLLPLLLHRSKLRDERLVGIVKAMAQNVGKDAFLRQQKSIMGRIDSRESLRAIGCPTLVLCGDEDLLTPVDRHREMATLIPGARLEIVAGCGHLSTLEKPVEVNRALQAWLDQ